VKGFVLGGTSSGVRKTATALAARAGDRLRGHEFHDSTVDPATDARYAFDVLLDQL
jgi:cobyrinic acid a,c-diamide synthase